ncbi:MAG: DUF6268 family outer membrane beta-barrel protein [Chloroherpetonaceae bacterium]|nr:DUF6268 family outer membrane beta-barrel protein [Chloroherpetonaceae bacterium]MDW8437386.1 DUF6268 family outer membrane beta-barrel protein [Chloroherpetonaceae bacterium]
MKRAVFALLCVLLSPALLAQREQASFRYEEFGTTTFSNPEPQRLSPSARFGARQAQLNLSFRTLLGEEGETVIHNGFQYRYLLADFANVLLNAGSLPPEPYPSKEFHFLFYDFLALHSLSDAYTLVAAFRPGIFSDFKNVASEHFRIEGAVFIDRQMSESLTMGLGVARSSNFGRVLILPILHVLYFGGSTFMLDMLIPSRAELWFYPTKSLEAGVSLSLSGSQYAIGEKNPFSANQFGFANATISPILRYNLFAKLYLSAELGYAFVRRAELVNNRLEGDLRFVQRFNPANVWLMRFGLQTTY